MNEKIHVKKKILSSSNTTLMELSKNLIIGKHMNKRTQILSRLVGVIAVLLIFAVAAPVYAGPKKKADQPKGNPVKTLSGEDCGKGVIGKGDSKCGPKDTGSVKKKVVKKVGAAAVVGGAGKKVTSGLKD